MVESLWPNTTQKARVSVNVHNDCRSLLNTPWGLRGAVFSPPVSPGQSPGRGTGGEVSRSSEILHFKVLEKRLIKTELKTLSY